MNVKRIDHINIVYKDLDPFIEFFQKLGFNQTARQKLSGDWVDSVVGLKDVEAEFAAMELTEAQTVIELLKYFNPKYEDSVHPASSPNQQGYRHIALEVDKAQHYHDLMLNMGYKTLSDVQTVPNYKDKKCFTPSVQKT